MINKIYQGVAQVEQAVCKITMLSILGLTFISALSRLINVPLPWSLELTLLLFAWFAFLAASQATRHGAHLGVNVFVKLLPQKIQDIILALNKVMILGFLGFIGYNGVMLSILNFPRQITSLGISYSFVTISLSVGCALMFVSESILLYDQLRIIAGKPKRVGEGTAG